MSYPTDVDRENANIQVAQNESQKKTNESRQAFDGNNQQAPEYHGGVYWYPDDSMAEVVSGDSAHANAIPSVAGAKSARQTA